MQQGRWKLLGLFCCSLVFSDLNAYSSDLWQVDPSKIKSLVPAYYSNTEKAIYQFRTRNGEVLTLLPTAGISDPEKNMFDFFVKADLMIDYTSSSRSIRPLSTYVRNSAKLFCTRIGARLPTPLEFVDLMKAKQDNVISDLEFQFITNSKDIIFDGTSGSILQFYNVNVNSPKVRCIVDDTLWSKLSVGLGSRDPLWGYQGIIVRPIRKVAGFDDSGLPQVSISNRDEAAMNRQSQIQEASAHSHQDIFDDSDSITEAIPLLSKEKQD